MVGGKAVNGNPVIFPREEAVPYHVYWKVLNAKDYGVPQNRERVFIIGIRDDKDNNFTFPKEMHLEKKLKDVLEENVDEKYFLSEKMVKYFTDNQKGKGVAQTLDTSCNQGIWIADYRSDEGLRIRKDNISPCMTSSMKGGEWKANQGTRNPPLVGFTNNKRLNENLEKQQGKLKDKKLLDS